MLSVSALTFQTCRPSSEVHALIRALKNSYRENRSMQNINAIPPIVAVNYVQKLECIVFILVLVAGYFVHLVEYNNFNYILSTVACVCNPFTSFNIYHIDSS